MGSQATVVVRTDYLGEIKRNAQEFVDNMCVAINDVAGGRGPKDFDTGAAANPGQVVDFHHCDNTDIVATSGGRGVRLAAVYNQWYWKNEREMAIGAVHALIQEHKLTQKECEIGLFAHPPRMHDFKVWFKVYSGLNIHECCMYLRAGSVTHREDKAIFADDVLITLPGDFIRIERM